MKEFKAESFLEGDYIEGIYKGKERAGHVVKVNEELNQITVALVVGGFRTFRVEELIVTNAVPVPRPGLVTA